MHPNASLANEIRAWETGKPYDESIVDLAKVRGLIAPNPKTRCGFKLTRKGVDFVRKWH